MEQNCLSVRSKFEYENNEKFDDKIRVAEGN